MEKVSRQTVDVSVNVNSDILGYLNNVQDEHYSRLNAFCYLLALSREQCSKAMVEQTGPNLATYSTTFKTSINQLSRQFGWQRLTVHKFLDKLEEFGCLAKVMTHKDCAITMHATIRTAYETPLPYDFLVDAIINAYVMAIDQPEKQKTLASYATQMYGQIVLYHMGEDKYKEMITTNTMLFIGMLATWSAYNDLSTSPDQELMQEVSRMFEEGGQWQWKEFAMILRTLVDARDMDCLPSDILARCGKDVTYSLKDLDNLDAVYNRLLQLFPVIEANTKGFSKCGKQDPADGS